jgi:dienelactone hydrolase
MREFLMAIVTWLSANCDLPANYDLPAIRYASPVEITYMRHGAFTVADRERVAAAQKALPADSQNSTVAIYDHKNHAIVLPTGWTATTPAEQSIVVHELVHHLQYTAQLKFACPQEREFAAYKAQDKWLQLFGRTLEGEFGIDGFTILANSQCLN